MKKTTKRLLICIPIAVVLIVAIIVGACFYFNSNQYRFRKSAFYGEYARSYLLDEKFKQEELIFRLCEKSENGSYTQSEKVYGLVCEDGKYWVKDSINEKHNIDEFFEEAVASKLKEYYSLFNERCVVRDGEIEFLPSGETLNFLNDTFSEGDMYNLPRRTFETKGGSLNLTGNGHFSTNYLDEDPRGGLLPAVTINYTSISLNFDIYISDIDGDYKLTIYVEYLHIEDYKNENQ